MALPVAAIPIIGSLIDKVLDKVAKDKIDDATREKLRQDAQRMLMDEGQEELQQFYDFVLDYEGRAAEHGKFIQWLRGSVRPVLTYVANIFFFYIVWIWLTGNSLPAGSEMAVKLVFGVTLLMDTFWFGDRFLQKSGLIELLKSKEK